MIGFNFYLYSILRKSFTLIILKQSLKENQFGFIYNKKNTYFITKMMNFYNLIYKSSVLTILDQVYT